MRLGQVAWALGVNEKTADNAIRILGLARPLDEDTVRALGLALRAKHRYGIPLKRAFPIVRAAMLRPGVQQQDAVARELLAYLREIEAGLHSAANSYAPLRRGPAQPDPGRRGLPDRLRRHPAVRRAFQRGLDLSLLRSALNTSPDDRLHRVSDAAEAVERLRRR